MELPPLFNPSNDMALAANVRQYFPPRRIQQMEEDLVGLARFWDNGPWGWSLATKQRYLRMGIPDNELPSDEWLATHRRLSSREFAVEYYRNLAPLLSPHEGGRYPLLPCMAQFCTSMEEVELIIHNPQPPNYLTIGQFTIGQFLTQPHNPQFSILNPQFIMGLRRNTNSSNSYNSLFQSSMPNPQSKTILKSPWSSSGRGNIVIDSPETFEESRKRIERIIREQGGISVEPFYANKALDFAMEFWIGDEGVRFLGYSVFFTDETGHYGGNWVESQEQLSERIQLPGELLESLITHHKQALAELPYRGPVGIDMMRMDDGRVHPCVEINFRMTMGLLALLLYNKGIRDDQFLSGRAEGFTAQIRRGRLCLTAPIK